MVACHGSRLDPEIIATCKPSDLFVTRKVVNLIPPCMKKNSSWHGASAALQFAACSLEVEPIVVLGYANCGGIRSLFNEEGEAGRGSGVYWCLMCMAGSIVWFLGSC